MKTIIDIFGRGLVARDISTRDSEPESGTYLEQLEAENRELKQRLADRARLEELEAENQALKERTADQNARRRTRDELLEAVEPGKLIALGRVWDGIGERLDGMVEELRDLENGLTVGRTLSAEDVAEYSGLNRARQALTDFQVAVREAKGIAGSTADRRTTDSRQDWSARFLDQARDASRTGIARINEMNREHAGKVAGRTTDSVVPFAPPARGPMTISQINEANRRNAARFTDQQRQMAEGNGDDWPPRAA